MALSFITSIQGVQLWRPALDGGGHLMLDKALQYFVTIIQM